MTTTTVIVLIIKKILLHNDYDPPAKCTTHIPMGFSGHFTWPNFRRREDKLLRRGKLTDHGDRIVGQDARTGCRSDTGRNYKKRKKVN